MEKNELEGHIVCSLVDTSGLVAPTWRFYIPEVNLSNSWKALFFARSLKRLSELPISWIGPRKYCTFYELVAGSLELWLDTEHKLTKIDFYLHFAFEKTKFKGLSWEYIFKVKYNARVWDDVRLLDYCSLEREFQIRHSD